MNWIKCTDELPVIPEGDNPVNATDKISIVESK